VADAVVSIPELASMTAQGARQVFRLAKHGGKLALTKGYGLYLSVTADEILLANIYRVSNVMKIPLVQLGSGVLIGMGIELKSLDLPPDFSTGYFFFDYGLQIGTLFGKSIKELRK
jgi:hypothetical protein